MSPKKYIWMGQFHEIVTVDVSSDKFTTMGYSFQLQMVITVQINNSFHLIRNIFTLENSDHIMLVLERFLTTSDFFKTPLNSSALAIVKASNLAGRFETRPLTDNVILERNMLCFPTKEYMSSFLLAITSTKGPFW